jgi:hypothetical protein
MMNADPKRASFSATLVFADLRQVTNEIEEARQYSILASCPPDLSRLIPFARAIGRN